jgi:hypothetical protein
MIFAVTTYLRGAHEQRQVAAIGILQDYLKFSVDPTGISAIPEGPISGPQVPSMTFTARGW